MVRLHRRSPTKAASNRVEQQWLPLRRRAAMIGLMESRKTIGSRLRRWWFWAAMICGDGPARVDAKLGGDETQISLSLWR
ncbi:hypothetical protein RIF29_39322 [Crotalaria pallida]|uniref:Uncharacterized protein n=1 Tax=Crotalaria pallida TaxID=3830 RepID=A0AAN9HPI4_CROPI